MPHGGACTRGGDERENRSKETKDLVTFESMDRKLKLLDNYLEDAISYRDNYPSESDDIKKEKIIKNFLNEVISFLDYSLTGFPNHEKLLKEDAFPRDTLIKRLDEFNNTFVVDKYPNRVISYLVFCYKINQKYDNALFYVI